MQLTTFLFTLVHLLALTSAAMTGNFMGLGSVFNTTQTAIQRLQQVAGHLPDTSSLNLTGLNLTNVDLNLNLTQLANRTGSYVDAAKPQIARAGNATKDYVVKHPYQTIFSIVGLVYPGGLLNLVGYGRLGPWAGSFAAWSQSYLGNPVARSVRACLQSAAMNGYAAAPVLNTVRGVIVSAGGYMVWKEGFKNGKVEQQEGKEGKEE
ncbi:hypothetical protein ASPFODRAFT_45944 [Aspergillus luchuensis CBS 106.47]|uniref:Uncharacterized protein n=1 Tax=Aspergillus luchuensis (strain CBS 106.47) TaxID=1137211 RepID=A0A1M3TI79_ASPLC|nr:hypothetical protein ASPFODRAFT_45944 [Aspergillus luchuensis CBS 106.47]